MSELTRYRANSVSERTLVRVRAAENGANAEERAVRRVEYDIDGIHRVHGIEVPAVPGMFDQDHEVG